MNGEYRTTKYGARFNEKENAYVVTVSAAEGSFKGERAFMDREAAIKFHCLKGAGEVKKVTVNGEKTDFVHIAQDVAAFPLGAGVSAPDADTVFVSFRMDAQREHTVKFYL